MKPHEMLKSIRADRNLSRREIAELLGVTPRTMETWEHGRRLPGARKMKHIVSLLEPDAKRRAQTIDAIENAAERAEDDGQDRVAAQLRAIRKSY